MKVVELDEKKLVGIRVVCPDDQYVKEIPKTSALLKQRLGDIQEIVHPARSGPLLWEITPKRRMVTGYASR